MKKAIAPAQHNAFAAVFAVRLEHKPLAVFCYERDQVDALTFVIGLHLANLAGPGDVTGEH